MLSMTAVRSTPNLSSPATQNTAPVFEFRCLWTQDLRKKKKKWHDGTLKFHTFNKRLMVWDDQKNYIGDAHWRDEAGVGEGDELSLDRGALVEVGERIGATETDLAPLRETVRQHTERTNNAVQPSSKDVPRSSALHSSVPRSQWQPKSLSAILGTSQGPIGRARIPTKSPFEQKQQHAAVPNPDQTRPVKRLRLIDGQENRIVANPNPSMSKDALPEKAVVPRRIEDIHSARERVVRERGPLKNVFTSPPDTTTTHVEKQASPPKRAVPTVTSRKPAQPSAQRQKKVVEGREDTHSKTDARSRILTPTGQKADKHVSKSGTAKPQGLARAISTTSDSTTKLRFQKKAPRKKLMYRDLLPSTTSVLMERSKRVVSNESARDKRNRKKSRRDSDLSEIFHSSPFSQGQRLVASRRLPAATAHVETLDEDFRAPTPVTAAILISSSPEPSDPLRSPSPDVDGSARNEAQPQEVNNDRGSPKQRRQSPALVPSTPPPAHSSQPPTPPEPAEVDFVCSGDDDFPDSIKSLGSPDNGEVKVRVPTASPVDLSIPASSPITSRLALLDEQLFALPSQNIRLDHKGTPSALHTEDVHTYTRALETKRETDTAVLQGGQPIAKVTEQNGQAEQQSNLDQDIGHVEEDVGPPKPQSPSALKPPETRGAAQPDRRDEGQMAERPVTRRLNVSERSQPKPFRRVLSVNDAPVQESRYVLNADGIAPSLLASHRLPARDLPTSGKREATKSFKGPIKLQKSKSLSEVIDQTTAKVAPAVNLATVEEEPDVTEQGPWTTHEAWDLFAWWPDDQQKPDYGVREVENPSNDVSHVQDLGGFVSAMDMI